ncbi:MAG: twin-arginine translocase subunit TatC [Candidatus Kapabacteria bacterium]|nr:twin-arginine translocase subunit TatC [Candidatus Kapabacteria bacterium]
MENEKENKDSGEEKEEIGFMGHLDELRKRIIFAFVGIVIGCIISGFFIEQLMDYILLAPAQAAKLSLQNLQPFGIPFLYFKVIFITGFIISFPFLLWQIWLFIAPGLYENERKWASKITFFTSISFFVGVAFAYFLMIPSMLGFAATFGTDKIRTDIDVNAYFGFVTLMILASGIIFEMPMVSYVLAKAGLITSKGLRSYWRHAVVVIIILAAILTPTPDPINQMFFALPLFILYEISIWIVKLVEKKPKDE